MAGIALLLSSLPGPTSGLAVSEARPDLSTRTRPVPPKPRFVGDAQRALHDLGYRPGPIDGIVGPRTRAALTRFQRAEGLLATGRLDPETMVRLDVHERLFRAPAGARVRHQRVEHPARPRGRAFRSAAVAVAEEWP
ncbi:MAG: peptidoglycan-binding protein [Candidatus Rokubacteria bacterium]|nr:peptidoglycan-binding protein [Candidatus Rokubacteria bacterium]MBI3105775.1 peptidoglycan-binding protein [Candidatus Rokubacteria bacterium]